MSNQHQAPLAACTTCLTSTCIHRTVHMCHNAAQDWDGHLFRPQCTADIHFTFVECGALNLLVIHSCNLSNFIIEMEVSQVLLSCYDYFSCKKIIIRSTDFFVTLHTFEEAFLFLNSSLQTFTLNSLSHLLSKFLKMTSDTSLFFSKSYIQISSVMVPCEVISIPSSIPPKLVFSHISTQRRKDQLVC